MRQKIKYITGQGIPIYERKKIERLDYNKIECSQEDFSVSVQEVMWNKINELVERANEA